MTEAITILAYVLAIVFIAALVAMLYHLSRPARHPKISKVQQASDGYHWLLEDVHGERYHGNCTVYKHFPSGRRCETSLERHLEEAVTAHVFSTLYTAGSDEESEKNTPSPTSTFLGRACPGVGPEACCVEASSHRLEPVARPDRGVPMIAEQNHAPWLDKFREGQPHVRWLEPSKFDVETIAKVCHAANRGLQATLGEHPNPEWDLASEHLRASVREGVEKILKGEIRSPQDSHESWLEFKRNAGWVYGPTKDEALKTHPCCVPYDELPSDQRVKDLIFWGIVHAMIGVVAPPVLDRLASDRVANDKSS